MTDYEGWSIPSGSDRATSVRCRSCQTNEEGDSTLPHPTIESLAFFLPAAWINNSNQTCILDFLIPRRIFLPSIEQTDKPRSQNPAKKARKQEASTFSSLSSSSEFCSEDRDAGKERRGGEDASSKRGKEREKTENCGNVVRRG